MQTFYLKIYIYIYIYKYNFKLFFHFRGYIYTSGLVVLVSRKLLKFRDEPIHPFQEINCRK